MKPDFILPLKPTNPEWRQAGLPTQFSRRLLSPNKVDANLYQLQRRRQHQQQLFQSILQHRLLSVRLYRLYRYPLRFHLVHLHLHPPLSVDSLQQRSFQ